MKARDYALYVLNRRSHTRKELETKLYKKGFETEEIVEILDEFAQRKWLNDYLYAETYILNQIEYGFKSKMQIQYKLMEKGVDKADVMGLLGEHYTKEKEWIIVKYLIEKYSRSGRLSREKLVSRLGRKGFPVGVVVSVLDEEEGLL